MGVPVDDRLPVAVIGYQLYRLALQPTAGVGLLTIFDAYIVWPTYREYGKQRASVSTSTAGA